MPLHTVHKSPYEGGFIHRRLAVALGARRAQPPTGSPPARRTVPVRLSRTEDSSGCGAMWASGIDFFHSRKVGV